MNYVVTNPPKTKEYTKEQSKILEAVDRFQATKHASVVELTKTKQKRYVT